MHGGLVALIVAACLMIPIVGILAAIAIPAYDDYLSRAKVVHALAGVEPLKLQVAEFHARHARCPSFQDEGFEPIELPGAGQATGGAAMPTDGNCMIALTIRNMPESAGSRQIWLTYAPRSGSWSCESTLEQRYLPSNCREY